MQQLFLANMYIACTFLCLEKCAFVVWVNDCFSVYSLSLPPPPLFFFFELTQGFFLSLSRSACKLKISRFVFRTFRYAIGAIDVLLVFTATFK